MLFAQKVFVIMEVCAYPYVTRQSVSAQLDLPENAAKSTWMNAPVNPVTMVELVLIPLKAIGVSVLQVLLDYSVMKKIAIVTKYHQFVQNEQCAETSRDLETSVAYAVQDIKVKNAMLPLTPVPHLHAGTELNVNSFNKVDSSADAKPDGKDHCVTKTLMTAPSSHVHLELIVPILWMITDATVPPDLMESDVNKK